MWNDYQIMKFRERENGKCIVCLRFPQNLVFGRFTPLGTLSNDDDGNENVFQLRDSSPTYTVKLNE